jgi:hypothetical protein
MSRLINTEPPSKRRNKAAREIVLCIRTAASCQDPDQLLDLMAQIAFSLEIIEGSIEQSVTAWEKRNYWVKADRYRLQWEWVQPALEAVVPYLESGGGSANIPVETLVEIAEELGGITISPNHRMGKPWTGAYAIWQLRSA